MSEEENRSQESNKPQARPDDPVGRAASEKPGLQSTVDSQQSVTTNQQVTDNLSEEEGISPSQPLPQSQPQEMEVHKHPHNVTHKKKWAEYVLEFAMIFFAVFLGFVAENTRENIVERNKTKEFVESMVDDLKKDTANFQGTYLVNQITLEKVDSLISLLRSGEFKDHTQQLYYLARLVAGISQPYLSTDRTFNQMRSSGNLRLIQNHTVSDSITNYYYKTERLKFQTDIWLNVYRDFVKNIAVVFDGAVFQEMYREFREKPQYIQLANGRRILDAARPSGNPSLANETSDAIKSLIASAHFLYSNTYGMENNALNARRSAINLIGFLQKHYHLKDE